MAIKFKELQLSTKIEVYVSEDELLEEERNLLQLAKQVANKAYAPYSNFYVGAAVLLENGKIITGNNQENAAYPSGLCAERVALFYASAEYNTTPIKTIAITCKSPGKIIENPVSPCGSCRQAIAEYEDKYKQAIRIIMSGEKGEVYACNSIADLLPLMFNRNQLV